ncbi:hypothetical protein [Pleurocapsa sp. PCC 7319]|uniref:hypothetical protein n=1 Tax=Pleurocapsa sp. PCC 7319 TaxID=118161 RepID=UPI00034CA1E9|nr:hypothetical protein [Pleurocapsa sp. PCC 7319]
MKLKREELEKTILEQYPLLRLSNLKALKKEQLETLIANKEIMLPVETLVKIFAERNERADVNKKLNRENFGLNAKIGSLTNWSKSEIINSFKRLYGKATKDDDKMLASMNAVSIDTAHEKINQEKSKARYAINKAAKIGKAFEQEYKSRNHRS